MASKLTEEQKKRNKEYKRKYYLKNKEKLAKEKKIYYQENKEKWILSPEEKIEMNSRRREFYKNNREAKRKKMNVYQDTFYKKNKVRINSEARKRRKNFPEESKAYSKKVYARHKEKKAAYRKKNAERDRPKNQERERARYKNDIQFRLSILLRKRLYGAIKFKSKKGSAVKLLGMPVQDFIKYFENLFQPGMSWDNKGEWHIDHRIPLASFNLEDAEELAKACHYTNLQPLWALDNIKKGAKLPHQLPLD